MTGGADSDGARPRQIATPPALWRRLLQRVLPWRDRQMLLDEMDVLYQGRFDTEGEEIANRWYRREVLQFARRWPLEWLGGTVLGLRGEAASVAQLTRQTTRRLLRVPGFALISILTLALGIAASAVIVGIVDRALLRPLPYPEPDDLVAVLDGWGTSLGSIEIMQAELSSVAALGGAQNAEGVTLEMGDSPPRRATVASVSPEYFEALQVAPVLGRLFLADEVQPGRARVVVLGYDFWQSHFGGEADALDRPVVLDGESYTVVGVLPRGFDLPSPRNELWRPVVMDASNPGTHWGSGLYSVVARTNAGVTPDRVREDLLRVQEQVRMANPLWTPNAGFWDEAKVTPLRDARSSGVRTPLVLLLGAVGLVLLVVCANVASLFVSRSRAQGRETAVRAALGAPRSRLAREQLLEVLLISVLGLVAGLGLAALGLELLRPYLPMELPGAQQTGLDARVVGITATVAVLTALAAGVLPAWRTSQQDPAAALSEAGRGRSASKSRRRVTRLLVGAQLAVAVVLVASAGLLTRTLVELNRVDPGFTPSGRATAEVHLPPGLSEDEEARAVYFSQLLEQLESHPAVGNVAFASTIPFGAEEELIAVAIDGVTADPNDLPVLYHHRVSPDYFEVMNIPVLQGRAFDDGDRFETPLVAVVDEEFVRRFLADIEPVGQTIRYPWRGAPAIQVVGVVGATSHGELGSDVEPTVWVPLAQMGFGALGSATAVARATGNVDAALGAITARMRDVDERIAVSDMATYDELIQESMAGTRLLTTLLLVFAGTTLLLGCIGVYGVAAFSVREQLKEIGVRMALGASVGEIRTRILRDGLMLVIPGSLLGLLLAVPAARAMSSVLYGVAPTDPLIFAATPLLLGLAAIVAVYVPARRATEVDPATVLRDD